MRSRVLRSPIEMDAASSHRIARNAERAMARKWLYRFGCFTLAAGCLALEAGMILLGGVLALIVAPRLASLSEIHALTKTYLALAVFAAAIRGPREGRGKAAAWLIWLALLLGLVAADTHSQRDAEGLSVWFLVAACGIAIIQAAHERIAEAMLAAIPVPRTVAFLGNSASAAAMLTQLERGRNTHVRVIGFFDDRANRPGPLTDRLPCLGAIDGLVSYIQDAELSEVYMALPWSAGPRISILIERLRFLPLTVRLIPDHVPPALPGRGDGQFHGVVMPTLMVPPFSMTGAVFKRGLDLGGAALLMVPLIPLFMIVAICIRIDSPGPVFFRQVRSGQFGRPFRIYKFRTLHVAGTDSAAETLVVAGDRRVTRIGHLLRKYSIDELPQVFNVLLAQMSLVGPRPHAPRAKADGRIYAEVMPEYMLRYRVKPGMTGWAQVNGWRGNTDTEEQLRKRVEFDFQYIGKWSFRKDIEIMLRTIPAMLLPPAHNV